MTWIHFLTFNWPIWWHICQLPAGKYNCIKQRTSRFSHLLFTYKINIDRKDRRMSYREIQRWSFKENICTRHRAALNFHLLDTVGTALGSPKRNHIYMGKAVQCTEVNLKWKWTKVIKFPQKFQLFPKKWQFSLNKLKFSSNMLIYSVQCTLYQIHQNISTSWGRFSLSQSCPLSKLPTLKVESGCPSQNRTVRVQRRSLRGMFINALFHKT